MNSPKDHKQSGSLLLDDLLSGDQTHGLLNSPSSRSADPRKSEKRVELSTPSPLMAEAIANSARANEQVERLTAQAEDVQRKPIDPNAFADNFFAEVSADLEVDAAIKAAAHTVQVLGPLMSAITKWIDPNTEIDRTTRIMQHVLGRVRDDAIHVAKAMDVPADVSPAWLTSLISGYLMPIFVNGIDRGNGSVTDVGKSDYLIPFIALAGNAKNITTSGIPDASLEWQLSMALASATSAVMLEYAAFPYFINDPKRVAGTISEFLTDRILKGTLSALSESFELQQAEKKQLGSMLLNQSGSILAECWKNGIPNVLNEMKLLPIEERREILLDGYPLDSIFRSFENIYQGIELATISSIRALSPGRESQQSTPTSGQRMR